METESGSEPGLSDDDIEITSSMPSPSRALSAAVRGLKRQQTLMLDAEAEEGEVF